MDGFAGQGQHGNIGGVEQLPAEGRPPTGQQLVEQLLHAVCTGLCQRGEPGAAGVDMDSLSWLVSCLRPHVTSAAQAAHEVRLLGKGAQGSVWKVEYLTNKAQVARKVVVLTASQVQAGGALAGLQDMVHAAACHMGLVSPALLKYCVQYYGLHMTAVEDVTQHGIVSDGSCQPGVKVTIDMECMSCSLTQYVSRLHAAVSRGSRRRMLRGSPLGSRLVRLLPMLTTTQQVLKGVGALHAAWLIHADLKPDNILLQLCPETGAVLAAKLGDFGAMCMMDAQGNTEQAALATLAYQHPEKKELRYQETHCQHSSARFDITEACASLLQACLGLCPNTQLRSLLVDHTLMQLLLGETTPEHVAARSSGAMSSLNRWTALSSLSEQGPLGVAYVGMLRVLARGWHSGGRLRSQQLLAEVDEVWGACAAQLGLAEGQTLDPRMDMVLMDGSLFPLSSAALDSLFKGMSPHQVLRLCCDHPDGWEQYSRHLGRQCAERVRQRQMVLAERRMLMKATTPARAVSGTQQLSAAVTGPPVAAVAVLRAAPAAAPAKDCLQVSTPFKAPAVAQDPMDVAASTLYTPSKVPDVSLQGSSASTQTADNSNSRMAVEAGSPAVIVPAAHMESDWPLQQDVHMMVPLTAHTNSSSSAGSVCSQGSRDEGSRECSPQAGIPSPPHPGTASQQQQQQQAGLTAGETAAGKPINEVPQSGSISSCVYGAQQGDGAAACFVDVSSAQAAAAGVQGSDGSSSSSGWSEAMVCGLLEGGGQPGMLPGRRSGMPLSDPGGRASGRASQQLLRSFESVVSDRSLLRVPADEQAHAQGHLAGVVASARAKPAAMVLLPNEKLSSSWIITAGSKELDSQAMSHIKCYTPASSAGAARDVQASDDERGGEQYDAYVRLQRRHKPLRPLKVLMAAAGAAGLLGVLLRRRAGRA